MAEDPRAGATLGPFFLIREIACRGRGWVFDASLRAGAERVVLKLAAPTDSRAARRFLREAALLTRLRSPHVVQVLGAGQIDELLWMSMPRRHAMNLATWGLDLPPPGPMRTQMVLPVLEDVLRGLTDLHSIDVVHRDLTPDNVLLGDDGRWAISDLGLARGPEDEGLTGSGELLGTPAWLSPEMMTGRPVEARSDLYQWALIAHALLAGVLPFAAEGTEPLTASARRCREPVPPLSSMIPSLDTGVSDLVERNLESDPTLRHHAAVELLADLERLLRTR